MSKISMSEFCVCRIRVAWTKHTQPRFLLSIFKENSSSVIRLCKV